MTGAAGNIGYAILPRLGCGGVFGEDQPLILSMLEIPPAMPALKGVVMELQDCAFKAVVGMQATSDPNLAFKDADVVVLVGGFPRKKGMLRKDLIQKNTAIFKSMGEALNHAKPTCKVLVVANPANTNARTALQSCTKIPAQNFTCMTRLDHNRAVGQIAERLGTQVKDVGNVVIWGNHSATQYPDTAHGFVEKLGNKESINVAVNNEEYLNNEFLKTVQSRGAAIIEARGASSAMSAANAACDHLRTWLVSGTAPGEHTSMGIYSKGHYGIQKGIMYSFPVICSNGQYRVVEGLPVSSFARSKMIATQNELIQEAKDADEILKRSKL